MRANVNHLLQFDSRVSFLSVPYNLAMSSFDLILKTACDGCGSPSELYGSNCKHKTLCPSCGKRMAETRSRCNVCDVPVTNLIRDDEDEVEEEEGGLSKSGKELKKLLGKAAGLNESDAEEEEDDDDMEDENVSSPVLAPKQKDGPKDEPADDSPAKMTPAGSARGTPSTSKAKAKKKLGSDDLKITNTTPTKKESKPSVKEEPSSASKSAPSKSAASAASKTGPPLSAGPVTEEEIRSVLLATAPVTTQVLVANFKGRVKSPEEKKAFADALKRISKIKKNNGQSYVVLKEMK